MTTTIASTNSYKAFILAEPFYFEGYLCVITGRNGVGKTRLLESLTKNHTQIYIDDELLAPQKISLIKMSDDTSNILSPFPNYELGRKLAEQIYKLIENHSDIDNVPERGPVMVYPERRMGDAEEFKIKDIVLKAVDLFGKKMEFLKLEELELSILLHKDIINSRVHIAPASLSQLVINYYQTLERKNYNDFLISKKEEEINHPDETLFKSLLGDESPHIPFNHIIERMFRGKFIISNPDPKRAKLGYSPKLISKSTGEAIDPIDLSSGEKIIFWLAEKTFHTYYSKSKNIFNDNTVILIDEPDAHLHPQMVHDFYSCLENLHKTLGVTFIFNTHSPTTIALCPNDNIYNMDHCINENTFKVIKTSKDGAISQLLEGVSQISVNPDNNRQVYVENANDNHIYEKIYTTIKNRSIKIDPNISLSFVSAGPKLADTELTKHIISVYGESDKTKILLEKINGDGNCQQVIGMVEYLSSIGNRTVRGIIDWDMEKRNHSEKVVVMAKDYAYSIENIIYDPLSIYAYLTSNDYKKPNYFFKCEEDFFWRDCFKEEETLQKIVDKITQDLLGRPNAKNHEIRYMGGLILQGDSEYYIPLKGKNGHDFEKEVLKKFHDINKLRDNNNSRPLIYFFTVRSTLGSLGWEFVNSVIEDAFSNLQK